jgi:hypothetical protein
MSPESSWLQKALAAFQALFASDRQFDDSRHKVPTPSLVPIITVDSSSFSADINRYFAEEDEKRRSIDVVVQRPDDAPNEVHVEIDGRTSFPMIGGGKIFVPETSGDSVPANDEFLGYIQHFYHFECSSGLFMDQVHVLQSLRDVARAVVDRVHSKIWGRPADEIALLVASWISEDADLLESVVVAREKWFERSRGGELAASLARKDFWPELKEMAQVCGPPKRDW